MAGCATQTWICPIHSCFHYKGVEVRWEYTLSRVAFIIFPFTSLENKQTKAYLSSYYCSWRRIYIHSCTTHQVTNLDHQKLEGHPKTCGTMGQPQWKGPIWSPQSINSVPYEAVEWSCWVSANIYWTLNMPSTAGNTITKGMGLLTFKKATLGQRDTS